MPGHGHTPSRSQPSPAVLVTLRVVFVLLALCTCGLLTWAAPLRIALLRKRAADWVVFAAVLVLGIGFLVLVGIYGSPPAKEGEEGQLNTADVVFLLLLLALSAGVTTYYLIADIQHFRPRQPQQHAWGPAPSGLHDRPTYPYPTAHQQPLAPQQSPTQHQSQVPHQTPALHQTPAPHQTPTPHQTSAPRLHQVRAELDELSELLRKDRPQDGDGGRSR